jgi:hypothetical protein
MLDNVCQGFYILKSFRMILEAKEKLLELRDNHSE